MLDQIIRFSIKNKLIIGLLTLLLIIWGIWSATRLPIDAVPDITNNQVQIITVCPTLAGQEVEQLVTFPIEQSIANIPDLEETRSISRFGLSVITVVFKDEVDIYFARQLVNEKLKEAEEKIPKGLGTPELAPVSTGLGEVYQYIIHPKKGSENKYNAKDLRSMQDWIVARQLNGTPGIAEVNSFGGELKQYEVAVNPARLRAMGVSISEIFTALEQNNQNTGGAYIDKKPNAYFIRGIGLASSLEDIRAIAVKSTGAVPIFVKDVAVVRYGSAIRYGALTYNGEVDAVGGVVMMLKGQNSHEVVNRIKDKLPVIQTSLPNDVIIEPFLDRTDLVGRAIETVEKNLIEGALIVIFVLVLFLGNLRAGLIVASAIPLSLLFALGMMNIFGVSANLMSMGAIDFGLIVDGAVIVVEATLHHLGLRKSAVKLSQIQMDEEVFRSAARIRNSAAFGEIIILIVYIPILTLVGIEGKMFRPMAQTVGFAIIGALILSMTYIPMMCALLLPKSVFHKKSFSDRMMETFYLYYQPLLIKAIRFKYWLIAITVVFFCGSLWLLTRMGGEFIPQLQEGDYAFHCILPQGSSLSQSIETSMQAARIVRGFDEVKMVVCKTGSAEVPTDPMPPEATDLMIVLKPQKEWNTKKTYTALADEIIEKLELIPGVFFEVNQPIQMRFNELMTGIRQDVAVKIFGENIDTLASYAMQVNELIKKVPGVSAPQIEKVGGLPQINIEYDRTRIANYGLSIEEINDIVSTAFAGKKAGVIFENERRFDLVVRLDSTFRRDIQDVESLFIPTKSGVQIPLSQVARINYKLGAAQISREGGKRRIVIGFNVNGRDVESVVSEIRSIVADKVSLPTGYYLGYGGQFENLQKASNRLMVAVPISLLLIFMLLYLTFRSVKQAFLVFSAIPMSAIGGVLALQLRGMPFSISAGIGFIALFGVAVLNGIVLISTFNQLEKEGAKDIFKRVLEGTRIRLRPVLMTATVASFGFLPMAMSTSAGAEVQKPLATVVIGGLLTATFLTLFVLPLLYIIWNSAKPLNLLFHKKAIVSIVFLFSLLSGFSGQAQTQKLITMEDAIVIALQNNNRIKAGEWNVQAAKALKSTVGELPKLDVSAQLGQYNSTHFDQSYQVSQSIPFPSLFAARKNKVTADLQRKELDKESVENELKKEVRQFFCELEYLDFSRSRLRYLDSLFLDFVRVAKLRFKTGDIKKIEISSAETKRGEINLLLQQNEVLFHNAHQNLKALLNVKDSLVFVFKASYRPLQISTLLDSGVINNNPLIKTLTQDLVVADQNKKVERAHGLPDFTLGYTNQSLIGFQEINGQDRYFGAGNRFSSFSVGISLPLSYGATKARVRSLEFEKQALEAELSLQKQLFSVQLQQVLNQYRQDIRRYKYYQEQAMPNANDIVNAARVGYRTGDISYVEYLYALQTAADIELKSLSSIHQVNQSVITIQSIINQ